MLTPAEILGPNGRIAARLAHYETRPQQLAMADAVADAIARGPPPGRRGRHRRRQELRLPGAGDSGRRRARRFATEPRPRRVVISTHTISLQEQLIHKDLPLLNSVIPLEFSAVLVKGRHNYLSLRRLRLARDRASQPVSPRRGIRRSCDDLRTWSRRHGRRLAGRSRLSPAAARLGRSRKRQRQLPGPPMPDLQRLLLLPGPPPRAKRADSGRQSRAVLQRPGPARAGASILPDYDVVIFDEAHTIESVASDHLGVQRFGRADRVHAQQALQRPHQPRPAGASQAWPKRSKKWNAAAIGPTSSSTRLADRL